MRNRKDVVGGTGKGPDASSGRWAAWIHGILNGLSRERVAFIVVLIFSMGCAFDHLTTGYGVALPSLQEKNPTVQLLMEQGVWHEVEAILMFMGVFYSLIVAFSGSRTTFGLSMKVMAAVGLLRFCAGFCNLTLIMKVLG